MTLCALRINVMVGSQYDTIECLVLRRLCVDACRSSSVLTALYLP